jgi:kynurenine formamidase
MKIIDLSLEMYSGMPVYPGDPEVKIEKILTIEEHQFLMRRLEINSHDATHVNAPSHAEINGKNLSQISLDNFFGKCKIYKNEMEMNSDFGVIFRDQNIDIKIADQIIKNKPKFIGLSDKFDFDLELEKELLKHEIISYEKLVNTELLPEEFQFYGVPLNIKDGDGSPVRAFAIIN